MLKFIYSVIFLALHFVLPAQTNSLDFSGLITTTTNAPAPGVIVYFNVMLLDSTTFAGVTESSTDGQYQFALPLPNSPNPEGYYNVSMLDCNNVWNVVSGTFGTGNNNFVHDFEYCSTGTNPADSCGISIVLQTNSNGTLVYNAVAFGAAPFAYLWMNGETTQSIPPDPTYFGPYCVTVTDANGCVASACLPAPNACSVTVGQTPAQGLLATADGTPPFTFSWENGETSASITPATSGTYCVTMTDFNGCTASGCGYFAAGGNPGSCFVEVDLDTTMAGGNVVTAFPTGEAPFTFNWNTGATTPSTDLQPNVAEYCVTVTDANGCEATACIVLVINGGCSVSIGENPTGAGILLTAYPSGTGSWTYMWSTGEPTESILPNGAGEYCVTVTASNGCTATACYDYQPFQGTQIQGYVYLPDSLDPLVWQGFAELYSITPNGDFELAATGNLENIPNGWGNRYDFGTVADGQYLVKITVDPNDPISPEYLPTYYPNTVFWDEATVINIPSNQSYFNVIMDDGLMLNGPGTIGGLVTEGDGLKGNAAERSPGDPLEGVSVLLFDATENSLTHTVTDVNGEYSFGNLPLGTYQIMAEIAGLDQTERWVSLTAEEPAASGIDFEVNGTAIVNGIAELVSEQGFSVYPNPAHSEVTLRINAAASFEAQLTLSTLTGATVFAQHTNLTAGGQTITLSLSDLPAGVYFLQLTTGREVISRKVVKR